MSAQSEKAIRRRRRPTGPRVPVVVEERDRKPMLFGWGADLTKHQRQALKERIALFGGIALALVLASMIGWGWYQDNISHPAAVRAQNNKPIAQVGSYVIRMGYFSRLEKFQKKQLSNQQQQLQQQLSTLQANPRKNAKQLAQLQQEQTQLNSRLSTLAKGILETVIDDQVLLQRYSTAHVALTSQEMNHAVKQVQRQAGGPRHFAAFVSQSGMTTAELKSLIVADYLRNKVERKLAGSVGHYQNEVRASHILVKQKTQAEKLYHEVLAGASIPPLAAKYSKDPASAKKGGDLGYFHKGSMVPQFDKAAFAMGIGQVRLVHSQYGWHIIKVTGRKLVRLTPNDYTQAQQSAYAQWLARQKALLHVERFISPNKLPGAQKVTPPISQIPGQPGQVPGQVPGQPGQVPGRVPAQVPPGKVTHIQQPVTGKKIPAGKKR